MLFLPSDSRRRQATSMIVGLALAAAIAGVGVIAAQSVSITQGATPCSYSVDPPSISVGAGASSGAVNVSALGGCPWTATSNASWITITSGATGSGNGSAGYSIAANGGAGRTGTITIAGRTVTVVQAAPPPPDNPAPQPQPGCEYTIAPTNAAFDSSGGNAAVSLTTAAACTWTATTSAEWISVATGSGTGNGNVPYVVRPNTTAAGRNGTIVIGGQQFTVSQSGVPAGPACTYAVQPTSAAVPASGAAGSVSVTATAGCGWTATSPVPWISITSGASGTGPGSVKFTAAANTATVARTATLSVAGQSVMVSQAGVPCTYSLNPASDNVDKDGGTGSFTVTTLAGCSWAAVPDSTWVTITSGASGSASGTVQYSVAANHSDANRNAIITVANQTFAIHEGK
jgi:hypothetical protein